VIGYCLPVRGVFEQICSAYTLPQQKSLAPKLVGILNLKYVGTPNIAHIGTSRIAKRRRTVGWSSHTENGPPNDVEEGGYNGTAATIVSSWNEPSASNEGRCWDSLPPPAPPNDSHVSQMPNIGTSIKDLNGNGGQTAMTTPSSMLLPTEGSIIEARTLTQAIHPSHEPITRSNSRNGDREPSGYHVDPVLRNRMIFRACELFEISIETYQYLYVIYIKFPERDS
jgi:hypothetical protein